MGKLVTVEHELLRHYFHMHIAATLVRASSRLTLETECRFKIAERSPGGHRSDAKAENAKGQQ
jgi:hypothetical protein